MFVNMNIDIICYKQCIYGNMLMYMIIQMIVVLVWPIYYYYYYLMCLLLYRCLQPTPDSERERHARKKKNTKSGFSILG